jgi:hypothetical protein
VASPTLKEEAKQIIIIHNKWNLVVGLVDRLADADALIKG